MNPWLPLYLFCFASALALGAALTAVARRCGLRFNLLDRPSGRKAHARPVALTGGYAIIATFLFFAVGGGWIAPSLAGGLPESWSPLAPYLENLTGVRRPLAAILIGLIWIFAIGAIDDLRPLGPRIKLAAQILAVVPLLIADLRIRFFIPWAPLSWALTVFWAVALMNSFNFLDNMDGQCATIAATIAAVLAVAAYQGGELWLPALFLTLAGALVGFLFFNFHPASIFLGDAGSLTVGYLLAVFSIVTTFRAGPESTRMAALVPLAVMGVPLFDTASVMWIRYRHGAPLMVGDRNHFSHRLIALGFSVRQAAVAIGLLTGAIGLLALPLRRLSAPAAIVHLLALALLFTVIGAIEHVGGRRGESPARPKGDA